MATSGSVNFTVTKNEIIAGALRICGVLADSETATTWQLGAGGEALNMVVKAWQADGMPVWAIAEHSLALVNATSTYTITPKLMKVIQAFNRNSSTKVDIPMRIVTRDEYNRLGNKTTSGNPILLWANPNLEDTTIKVYPVPSAIEAASNVLILVYQKPFEDFDTSTDTPHFPSEYFDALKFALASRLSFEYGLEISDRKQIFEQAMILKAEALGFGTEEGSMFFGVDNRRW